MQFLFDFFGTIGDYVVLLVSFVINTIKGLFLALTTIVSGLSFTSGLAASMPAFLSTCFFTFVAIFVTKFIIGRMG